MDSVETLCEECGGNRFKQEVLEYKYKEKSIVNVLAMTIAEAVDFFEQKEIKNKLKSIIDVGLHYMTLGQPLDTLSGGECQRLKLAKELNKKGNIYIMDEPTTGLHMSDITGILKIIDRLVDKGNTVIVIEHNLDVIRNADWIIDVGVEGGSKG
ncbi:MAG: Excinuclease ATPase subunit, partial [Oscillospiraceae bacterium]|nr:Excinuclease ATPase subunit [Oscillospiraceae bacterium]